MEIGNTNAGRGFFATKYYEPLEEIFRETASVSVCCRMNKQLHDQYCAEEGNTDNSFFRVLRSFILSYPDEEINTLNSEIKMPALMLKNGYDQEVINFLSKSYNRPVPNKELDKISQKYHISKNKLKELINKVSTNNFNVSGLFSDGYGKGLFLKASIFNHSCLPNTFHIVTHDSIIIYAARKINVGEEITINIYSAYRTITIYL